MARAGWTDEKIDDVFEHHPPGPEDIPRYEAIRAGAKAFARIIRDNSPEGADQHAAMRLLRQTTQTANASIALKGRLV